MYDLYTMKIVFMTNESYDFCNLWLMKFMTLWLWQTYYEKHIFDKSIMTFVTAPKTNIASFWKLMEYYINSIVPITKNVNFGMDNKWK